MQGFQTGTQTLSDEYQQACVEVQNIIWKSLKKFTTIDHTFVWGDLGCHPLVGEGCAPSNGLHGKEHGGAVTLTGGGSEG